MDIGLTIIVGILGSFVTYLFLKVRDLEQAQQKNHEVMRK